MSDELDQREERGESGEPGESGERGERSLGPKLASAIKVAREILPGDSRYGDPLSTAGSEPRALLARRLGEMAERRPGILKEAGLSALQVWEAVAETDSGRRADGRRAVAFTDLVGFSDWALEAGDEAALELLRRVAEAIEPPVTENGGKVVKRLGDGMMAVFDDPRDAVAAIAEARRRLRSVEVGGYRPGMRAGIHFGTPRRLGEDFLGVDVNIAARVADEASAGELLVSSDALAALEAAGDRPAARRKLLFRAKGVPRGVTVYSLEITE